MSNLKVNHITNKQGNYGPVVAGIATVNSTSAMRIPSGNTGRRVEYNIDNDNDIVKDGLVLHLDFANPDCYSGDGTVVRDLSGAGYVDAGVINKLDAGTSVVHYSPDGGGCFKFDNRGNINFGLLNTDRASGGSPFVLRKGSDTSAYPEGDGDKMTVCSWVNVDMTKSANVIAAAWHSTSSAGWLLAANENDNTGNRPMPAVIVSDGGDGTGRWQRPGWSGPNIPAYDPRSLNYWNTVKSVNSGIGNTTVAVDKDTFTHLTQKLLRYDYTGLTAGGTWGTWTWINGLQNGMSSPVNPDSGAGDTTESDASGARPNAWGQNRNLRIGSDDNARGSYMKGKIAVVMVYNRELTEAEITQNYNAQRYRFGR